MSGEATAVATMAPGTLGHPIDEDLADLLAGPDWPEFVRLPGAVRRSVRAVVLPDDSAATVFSTPGSARRLVCPRHLTTSSPLGSKVPRP